jgi:hypothetical protein
MKNTFLAFTSSSYAYDNTVEQAVKRLKAELIKNNTKASVCGICDVTDVPDGVEIIHEPWTVVTSCKTKLEVNLLNLVD